MLFSPVTINKTEFKNRIIFPSMLTRFAASGGEMSDQLLNYHVASAAGGVALLASAIGVTIGAIIMVVGYSLGRAFIYSTPEYALLKLPYQILQAVVGAVAGMLICYKFGLKKMFENKVWKR